jgi:hypothetical protein
VEDRSGETGRHRLVDDRVRVRGLDGDALDRTFEDRTLIGSHGGTVVRAGDLSVGA